MSPVLAAIVGLLVALLAAVVALLYLWKVARRRREIAAGLGILANMRWRELSNLLVEALGPAGFERESNEDTALRGGHAEIAMRREGRLWLLSCKQGLNYQVTPAAVEEMVRSMRLHQAAGGVIATPGRIHPAARSTVANVELIDGTELWQLLEMLVPGSVLTEVAARARAWVRRAGAIAIAASLVLGGLVGWLLSMSTPAPPSPVTAPVVATAPRAARAVELAAPVVAPPVSEEEQRLDLAHALTTLPGVHRAIWSTRSTLQIFLTDPSMATDAAICQQMKRYDNLRASRLQMQPPPGDKRPVRFMQCAVY